MRSAGPQGLPCPVTANRQELNAGETSCRQMLHGVAGICSKMLLANLSRIQSWLVLRAARPCTAAAQSNPTGRLRRLYCFLCPVLHRTSISSKPEARQGLEKRLLSKLLQKPPSGVCAGLERPRASGKVAVSMFECWAMRRLRINLSEQTDLSANLAFCLFCVNGGTARQQLPSLDLLGSDLPMPGSEARISDGDPHDPSERFSVAVAMEVAGQVAAFRWSDGALLRALKRGAAPQGSVFSMPRGPDDSSKMW